MVIPRGEQIHKHQLLLRMKVSTALFERRRHLGPRSNLQLSEVEHREKQRASRSR